MHKNCGIVLPVNILTLFSQTPFSWVVQHTTVCLEYVFKNMYKEFISLFFEFFNTHKASIFFEI